MDKKSKQISGLKAGKIIQKANKYFSEAEKHFIIKELLSSGCTKAQIWEKYTGQLEERGKNIAGTTRKVSLVRHGAKSISETPRPENKPHS